MKKIVLTISLCLTTIMSVSGQANAQLGGGALLGNNTGEQDCAIWLCLPFHFPEGCEDAKRRMNIRLDSGRDPLPAYPQCSTGGTEDAGHFSVDYETSIVCRGNFELVTRMPDELEMTEKDLGIEVIEGDEDAPEIEIEEIDGDEDVPEIETVVDTDNTEGLDQICRLCPETLEVDGEMIAEEDRVCEEEPVSIIRRAYSVTVTISGQTYPPYVLD